MRPDQKLIRHLGPHSLPDVVRRFELQAQLPSEAGSSCDLRTLTNPGAETPEPMSFNAEFVRPYIPTT
jgi:hypothetical protein